MVSEFSPSCSRDPPREMQGMVGISSPAEPQHLIKGSSQPIPGPTSSIPLAHHTLHLSPFSLPLSSHAAHYCCLLGCSLLPLTSKHEQARAQSVDLSFTSILVLSLTPQTPLTCW